MADTHFPVAREYGPEGNGSSSKGYITHRLLQKCERPNTRSEYRPSCSGEDVQ